VHDDLDGVAPVCLYERPRELPIDCEQ
jgi:hypothetical protein